MDIGEGAEELVDEELDLEDGHGCFHFVVESRGPIHSLGDEFLNKVEVNFVLLQRSEKIVSYACQGKMRGSATEAAAKAAHPLSIGVIKGFQLNNIGMSDDPHDLKLTVLQFWVSLGTKQGDVDVMLYGLWGASTHLEALILEHTLDRGIFSRGRQFCLENYAKRPIAHNLALRILELPCLASYSILDLFADHLCKPCQCQGDGERVANKIYKGIREKKKISRGGGGGETLTSHPQGIEG